MTLGEETLERRLSGSDHGLSARRLWEHTELGQINVFNQAISARRELNDARAFIDVVWFFDDEFSLAGFTLGELKAGNIPVYIAATGETVAPELADSQAVMDFVRAVVDHLRLCSIRLAVRNLHARFLPAAQTLDVFGVPYLFSTLLRRLQGLGNTKVGTDQWQKTIENFQKKGLRSEELDRSRLLCKLADLDGTGVQVRADDLVNLCNFAALGLSVIPVVQQAQRKLQFATAPIKTFKRTKKLLKAQAGQTRAVVEYDPVLGYRIEQLEHQTLWGAERHWQAVTHEGNVIGDTSKQALLVTAASAAAVADRHAKMHFPKRVALGKWSHIAWSGGEDYREWLITLPYYPASYFSSHFNVRNVLVHVRCDVRQGPDGERVLLLQEVQSDWAQDARRAISSGDMNADDDESPPFLKEWPALAMKMILLHAAHQGLDAVAWTRGMHQVVRYKGLGATGLNELYDRTLPREVNQMMKPFGGACETLGVFVPTNFRIKQSEIGYEVYTPENELLGTAPTLEEARQFVPDQGHELLYEVHGLWMPPNVRGAVLAAGFPAWG